MTDFQGNKTLNVANTNLIKRYNYYSMRILESMEENSDKGEANGKADLVVAKKARLNEEIQDLEKDEAMSLKGAPLNLVHIDRYFYAPKISAQKQSPISQALQGQDVRTLCEESLDQAIKWNMDIKRVLRE